MHPIEEQILSLIEKNSFILDCETQLSILPIGTLSKEFYEDPRVKDYCTKHSNEMLSFRLALEKYINSNRSQPYLENLEAALLELGSFDDGMQGKRAGTYLMPITSELICQVYLLEDELLTNLFQKHFPTPPVRLFHNLRTPHIVQKKSIEIDETMKKLDVEKIERFIIKVQRHIRMKRRHQEEQNRIALRDERYLKSSHMSPEDLIRDANTPYKPKCIPELSARIMATAKKVAAFSTVKHITSEKAIQSIFDDALYGRRTLMDLYLGFEPASLHSCDILNGDANVACLGPQDIDPKAYGGIIIEFDLPKLIKNKPSAFYKQRDLEYQLDRIRKVELGKETISFDHTGSIRVPVPTRTYLKIMDAPSGRLKQIAAAPKSSFISYNLEQIHEVLTLNFFRFMDNMTDPKGNICQAYIDSFYRKVSQLTDEELFIFLTDLEKNMTDTAEFNFYGAHRIDFSTIQNITARYKGYTLNLPKFIHNLKQGNIDELRQARIKIPELFQTYRFLDYLLLQVQDSVARYYLHDLRKRCKTPNWIKYTPLLVPEKFELSWELHSEPLTFKQQVLVFVGVIIAIAATLLTLGIATYYVAKNERLRSQYIDTFFKLEPRAVQDAKNKWTQYFVEQNFFKDEPLSNNGLVVV